MVAFLTLAIAAVTTHLPHASGISLDIKNAASISTAASTLAFGLQSNYHNNASGTDATAVGTFPQPIYWWESGAAWGGMVDYWAYTNDTSYIPVTTQSLLAQVGPYNNYEPPAYHSSLGNDDQSFWAFAVLSAQEYGFPVPEGNASTLWLDLATAVWNRQMGRWNTTQCAGGLHWQIFPDNAGYDYKNSISNGAFFQQSARLARYTGNQTYLDWANISWNWMSDIGLISSTYQVFDGSDDTINCTQLDHTQWTYNPAVLLYGTAMLANYTNDQLWRNRTEGLLTSIETLFFSPFSNSTNIMYEAACEPTNTCDNDQFSFKAYLGRWMAKAAIVCPSIAPNVLKYLQASAQAAALSCSGGDDNQTCGEKWYVGGFDGSTGVGQQLSALETVQSLLLLGKPITPGHEASVAISDAPVTSTFPLTPPTNTPGALSAPTNPAASGRDAIHSGTSTNFGNRASMMARNSWLALILMLLAISP